VLRGELLARGALEIAELDDRDGRVLVALRDALSERDQPLRVVDAVDGDRRRDGAAARADRLAHGPYADRGHHREHDVELLHVPAALAGLSAFFASRHGLPLRLDR
jgi:hypothetical protein